MNDMDLMKRLVRDISQSPFIGGPVAQSEDSIKKLILLKQFGIISESYYQQQHEMVCDALSELYNSDKEVQLDNDKFRIEKKSEDWQDAIFVSKGTSHNIINEMNSIVNDAYSDNKAIKIRGMHTDELLQARIRSYNGDAYALDLLDVEGNQYAVTNTNIISEITQGRKFTFDTTYGFITCCCASSTEFGEILLNLLRGQKYKGLSKLRFMAYSDVLNLQSEVSMNSVDIYNINEVTEWLRKDNLDMYGPDGVIIYIEVEEQEESKIYMLLINRNTSEIEMTVDKSKIELDRYSDGIVQCIDMHTDEGAVGKLIIPYELGNEQVEVGTYLILPFDIIENKITWNNRRAFA